MWHRLWHATPVFLSNPEPFKNFKKIHFKPNFMSPTRKIQEEHIAVMWAHVPNLILAPPRRFWTTFYRFLKYKFRWVIALLSPNHSLANPFPLGTNVILIQPAMQSATETHYAYQTSALVDPLTSFSWAFSSCYFQNLKSFWNGLGMDRFFNKL